ncbi:hypothetical protein CXB77_09755 [Chromatium okenii]|uniref:CARDB domain-containing protein n=2 Tax=Chromatium okenii TaxID=61644 RepID=A0A2S7XQW0_9GAMM|nr:hypothetical protein CXB77_09755 [Chromatium okenii]
MFSGDILMKRLIHYLLSVVLSYAAIANAENYTLQHEEMFNTAEAQQIVRYGDIDNLGFGWPEGFDPFSGESTPGHGYPWIANSEDADGTDRIMVVSSYVGTPPAGQDGYTSYTSRPDNMPREIVIPFTAPNPLLNSAILQIFVDDFQALVWQAHYQVTMNSVRVPELEELLNSLEQTGPIGKLITFQIPDYIIDTMHDNQLKIMVDDPETGAGDGFAFDFFRLLINPRQLQNTGIINGYVFDKITSQPLAEAMVAASTTQVKTNAAGYYEMQQVPAGLVNLRADIIVGYQSETVNLDLVANTTITHDFYLNPLEMYQLFVNKKGDGLVTSKDGIINCGSVCSGDFESGSSVILTAKPIGDFVFGGWSDPCSNQTDDCIVNMNQAQTVTAIFNPISSYMLSINKIGKGTVTSSPAGINCGTACNKKFASGLVITLTAKPNSGATFIGWKGCTALASEPLQCSITLTNKKTVTATFGAAETADIKVTAIKLTPASPRTDSVFSAEITVKNQGSATVNGGYLDVWSNQPKTQKCSAFGEAWIDIGSLDAGASKTLTVNLRSNSHGSKTLRAFADSWCQTRESNEDNNQMTKKYTVK